MFRTFGVRSVTMDEIAGSLGISKKTVYAYFPTKVKLIEATALYVFNEISKGIEEIRSKFLNPIEEHFVIKDFVLENLHTEMSSPYFQLQKHYPQIFTAVRQKQQELLQNLITENLTRGVEKKFYQDDIMISFVCRIYFVGIMGIKDRDLFPQQEFSGKILADRHLEYHLKAIVTEKGLRILEEILLKQEPKLYYRIYLDL